MKEIFKQVKNASKQLQLLCDEQRNEILNAVADTIMANKSNLIAANAEDLTLMDTDNPLYDRLQLTEQRLDDIATDMRHVTMLPSPLGMTSKEKTLENGLYLRRISVPFGVIGMIYEARPNVTFDVFSLCFKSGNACILKGGKDADHSNKASIALIHKVLEKYGINPKIATLMPASHEATKEMLNAVGYIDLCIPRGGKHLIQFVRDTAKIPVIETGAGVVHAYFDKDGNVAMGADIINNAKTRRPSVCNTLDTLLIHETRLDELSKLCAPLIKHHVKIYADGKSRKALENSYPQTLLSSDTINEETYDTEWMDYKMAIKTVRSLNEALDHIAKHGSGHSECIITDNQKTAERFQNEVDAACVYVNAPTSFTDGAQFGLGAEIGISTQKLGPRGPMGLEEMTTYKWLINGKGQIRK